MIVRRMQVLTSVHCIFVQVPIYRYLVTYIVQDYNLMHRLYRQQYLYLHQFEIGSLRDSRFMFIFYRTKSYSEKLE